jgi:hypothetical protein
MANTDDKGGARAPAVVSDGLAGGAFRARVGTSEFAVGGQSGTDPYSHLEVAVSYHHGVDGGRDVFERIITLQGELDETQRAQLLQDASKSPVTRTLGVSADIRTRCSISDEYTSGSPASYETDLRELSIPNIDPD